MQPNYVFDAFVIAATLLALYAVAILGAFGILILLGQRLKRVRRADSWRVRE